MSIIITENRFAEVSRGQKHSQEFPKLPPGVWMLKQSMENFFFEKKEDFKLPSKIYGDHSIIDRYLKSFDNTEKNLGIILSGLKGTGKTITAQKLCIDSNRPVILITAQYAGPGFIDFITSPELSGSIVFIDEFEKIYTHRDAQRDLLSVMDGSFPTHLLFLLTVNTFNINEYLINRLNRIKYRKHYENLEEDVMEEVINDLLINKEHKQSIYDFFDKVGMVTFDLLINVIKEVNLFNESAIECGKHLNIAAILRSFAIKEVVNGKTYYVGRAQLDPYDIEGDNISIRRSVDNPYYYPLTETLSDNEIVYLDDRTGETFKGSQEEAKKLIKIRGYHYDVELKKEFFKRIDKKTYSYNDGYVDLLFEMDSKSSYSSVF